MGSTVDLAAIAARARRRYAELLASTSGEIPWWSAVVLTAGSQRQADLYSAEIEHRRERGALPETALVLSVADPDDQRVGSGGATFSALQAMARASLVPDAPESIERWWQSQRVLVIHSGGDSRRLPQYSLSGKLFAALPVETPWGGASTVFDEFMALSTLWVARLASGLVLASGDVVLTFEAGGLCWDRPGVSGVAIRQSAEVGSRHGVYVTDPEGRVYTFLQKPTAAEVRAAGGMLDGEQVAVDTGLLRFDARASASLTQLAGVEAVDGHWSVGEGVLAAAAGARPVIDLYRHVTLALTGQWTPSPDADPHWQRVADALHGLPFHCDIVEGDFTHVGTTALFRSLLTEESALGSLYETQQRLGRVTPPNVRSAGVIVDSILEEGGELGPASVVIECHLDVPVVAARGAILHGLENIPSDVRIPENTVVHQILVSPPHSRPAVVIRVYGVQDDPKDTLVGGRATWFGRPILEVLDALGLDSDDVWPGVAEEERTLWTALLYPVASVEEAWDCARWMMGTADSFSADRWRRSQRLSLASSASCVDAQQLTAARARRVQANWQLTAIAMAQSGTDVRPLVAQAPGVSALVAVGRALSTRAKEIEERKPTEAASWSYKASRFLSQAGLAHEAEAARAASFRSVGPHA
jgi:fucokinase